MGWCTRGLSAPRTLCDARFKSKCMSGNMNICHQVVWTLIWNGHIYERQSWWLHMCWCHVGTRSSATTMLTRLWPGLAARAYTSHGIILPRCCQHTLMIKRDCGYFLYIFTCVFLKLLYYDQNLTDFLRDQPLDQVACSQTRNNPITATNLPSHMYMHNHTSIISLKNWDVTGPASILSHNCMFIVRMFNVVCQNPISGWLYVFWNVCLWKRNICFQLHL